MCSAPNEGGGPQESGCDALVIIRHDCLLAEDVRGFLNVLGRYWHSESREKRELVTSAISLRFSNQFVFDFHRPEHACEGPYSSATGAFIRATRFFSNWRTNFLPFFICAFVRGSASSCRQMDSTCLIMVGRSNVVMFPVATT